MADDVHRTYRSISLRGIGGGGVVLAVVLAVWVVVDEAGKGQWLVAATAALWGIVIGLLIAEVFLRPAVSTTWEGVVLVNPFRTVVVPWAAVRGVETELALQILTDSGRRTSWAATGKRSSSALIRGMRARREAASPAMTELLRQSGFGSRGVTAPVECKIFIEAGLSEWRVATARAAAAAWGREPGAVGAASPAQMTAALPADSPAPAAATPAVPRVTWHRRWALAIAVPAALLLAVTLAL
jgi:Bacterial PH domain